MIKARTRPMDCAYEQSSIHVLWWTCPGLCGTAPPSRPGSLASPTQKVVPGVASSRVDDGSHVEPCAHLERWKLVLDDFQCRAPVSTGVGMGSLWWQHWALTATAQEVPLQSWHLQHLWLKGQVIPRELILSLKMWAGQDAR